MKTGLSSSKIEQQCWKTADVEASPSDLEGGA